MILQLDCTKEELKKLQDIRIKETPSLFPTEEPFERKFKYILLGTHKGNKFAIKVVGNWKYLLQEKVRELTNFGLVKIQAGTYEYTFTTQSRILFHGYVVIEDMVDREEHSGIEVREVRHKKIGPKPEKTSEETIWL